MTLVKKISIISFIKLHSIVGGIVGLFLGILYSFGGLILDIVVTLGWVSSIETPGLSYGTVLAFGALIGMPIIFAAAGLIIGIIVALLFNLYSRFFGGIEIDFN